jgi:hypothetical protein
MVWYYETFKKVGRLRIAGDTVLIEIDGAGVHDIPVSDVVNIISDAVELPLDPVNLPEGISSLSVSQLAIKFYIPVGGHMYCAIVRQVLNMIANQEKKAALWVPVG